jgi:penicillin-binding protein 1A
LPVDFQLVGRFDEGDGGRVIAKLSSSDFSTSIRAMPLSPPARRPDGDRRDVDSGPRQNGRPSANRLRWTIAGLGILTLAAFAAAAVGAWVASPSPSALAVHVESRLHGTTGQAIGVGAIPTIMKEAVVSTEDERFYSHHGVDVIGVVRAIPYDLAHLSFAQGASTITEQLAKVLYLRGNDHSPWRKLEDAAVAWKLENRYTKAQILDAYLNSAYFGANAYGIEAASERYFGIPPRRLDASQASLLAGLIQAPSIYDPYTDPILARARQADVLRSLVRSGFLGVTEATSVLARPLRLRSGALLPPLRGVDLAPGPSFVWWQLALGAGLALVGVVGLTVTRVYRMQPLRGALALRLMLLAAVVIGAAALVRSFRTA